MEAVKHTGDTSFRGPHNKESTISQFQKRADPSIEP